MYNRTRPKFIDQISGFAKWFLMDWLAKKEYSNTTAKTNTVFRYLSSDVILCISFYLQDDYYKLCQSHWLREAKLELFARRISSLSNKSRFFGDLVILFVTWEKKKSNKAIIGILLRLIFVLSSERAAVVSLLSTQNLIRGFDSLWPLFGQRIHNKIELSKNCRHWIFEKYSLDLDHCT